MVDRKVPLEVDIKDILSRLSNIETLLTTILECLIIDDEPEILKPPKSNNSKSLVDNSITARLFMSP